MKAFGESCEQIVGGTRWMVLEQEILPNKAYFDSLFSRRDPNVFLWPIFSVPIFHGSNFCALWQPTQPRISARFPSFSTRYESTTREAGRASPDSRS